jgi:hypothetical protein
MSKQRDQFVATYVASFLAGVAAVSYSDNCIRGWKNVGQQPVEDAEFLALQAWDEMVKQGIGVTHSNNPVPVTYISDSKPSCVGYSEVMLGTCAKCGKDEADWQHNILPTDQCPPDSRFGPGPGTHAFEPRCVVCGNGDNDWLHSAGIAGDVSHDFKIRCKKTMCHRKDCLDCYPEPQKS